MVWIGVLIGEQWAKNNKIMKSYFEIQNKQRNDRHI